MAVRSIIVAPDPRLKLRSAPVERVDGRIRRLMDDLLETMYEAPGIGLSAVQIGIPERVIVVDVAREGEARAPLRLANPEVLWQADEIATREEGCLSLPDQYAEVSRPAKARVRYLDHEGRWREIAVEGILAQCLQHEIDHLEGRLFVDYLSTVRRNIILRKLVKARRTGSLKSA